MLPWRSWLAHALVEAGQVAEARRLAAEELEHARRLGARGAIGVALAAAARAAGGEDEIGLLREAVAALDVSAARLQRARAHRIWAPCCGVRAARWRRATRCGWPSTSRTGAARPHSRTGRSLSSARPAHDRAAGCCPASARSRGASAGSPSLRPAGRQNREIAETLVVTLATVEYHLRHAYRKLGIASRTQLTTVLDAT